MAAAPAGNTASVNGAEYQVGVIHLIGARQRFVLIEVPSALATGNLTAGQLLHGRPYDATSKAATVDLRVSRERRAPFIAADVVAGQPHVGDLVFLATERETLSVPLPIPVSSVLPPTLFGRGTP